MIFTFLLISVCIAQIKTKDYSVLISEIELQRKTFQKAYETKKAKDSILKEARNYLFEIITNEVFPAWYGTKWDFNGMTRKPQNGKIACGYFVTNTLSDVGYKIPRIKWAQSPSEIFIKKLAAKDLKRFHNVSMTEIEKYLKAKGDGLYLVGLDFHTGFIVVKNGNSKFVHSSYYFPETGVMSENINSRNPLSDSKYRVIGKLFSDEMILNWINEKPYS